MAEGPLQRYRQKRNFNVTSEPTGAASTQPAEALSFVIQKHWASRLHYDFRLEFDGVLLSWAVPKGPSFDPKKMQMAIHVEDHPLDYASFEGTIPKKQYGAGTVIVWDRGTWEPVGDPRRGMAEGKLVFRLHGEKLAGLWELVRIAKPDDKQDPWMLFKKKDEWARPGEEYDVITALPDSVVAHPLGLVEAREPRGAAEPLRDSASAEPDLAAAASSICAGVAGKLWLKRMRSPSAGATTCCSSARREASGTWRRSRPPWNGRSKTKYSIASLVAVSIAFCRALKSGTPASPMTTISPSSQAESMASASIAAASIFILPVQSWPPRVISLTVRCSIRAISR